MSFRVLYITRSALLAQQAALDITSGNIANVNTPGYTRRRPVLVPIVPQPGAQGTGVLLLRIQEFRARYLEQQLRNTTARHAAAESDERVLQRITAILGEPAPATPALPHCWRGFWMRCETRRTIPPTSPGASFCCNVPRHLHKRLTELGKTWSSYAKSSSGKPSSSSTRSIPCSSALPNSTSAEPPVRRGPRPPSPLPMSRRAFWIPLPASSPSPQRRMSAG
jgi:hypothetical protein